MQQKIEGMVKEVAVNVWSQQVGETPLAHKLFVIYRDMGVLRDLRVAAKDMGRSYKSVKNLSISNQWEMRAQSYDNHVNLESERLLQYEIIAARKRHYKLGTLILDFAQESIGNLQAMGDLLSVKDVVLLAETGAKLESTALGMATDITESRIAADVSVQQVETLPLEILERIGREISTAKSLGEPTEEIEAQFEDLAKPFELSVDGNGDGKVKVPVSVKP